MEEGAARIKHRQPKSTADGRDTALLFGGPPAGTPTSWPGWRGGWAAPASQPSSAASSAGSTRPPASRRTGACTRPQIICIDISARGPAHTPVIPVQFLAIGLPPNLLARDIFLRRRTEPTVARPFDRKCAAALRRRLR